MKGDAPMRRLILAALSTGLFMVATAAGAGGVNDPKVRNPQNDANVE
jgi:hypothetical protein